MKMWRKQHRKTSAKADITWDDLMHGKGMALWRLRTEATQQTESPFVELSLRRRKRHLFGVSSPPSVALITCPRFFLALEKEQDMMFVSEVNKGRKECDLHHGFDKLKDPTPGCPQPLTRCTGEKWIRQRQQVASAFHNLPDRSLQAMKSVDIDAIIQDATAGGKHGELTQISHLDWKHAARKIALQWVVRLFWGPVSVSEERQTHIVRTLESNLLEYWKSIRSEIPVAKSIVSVRRHAVVSMLTTGGGGVLDSLFESGLSVSEARDNGLNAMIAAFDAFRSLLFWTIVNILRVGTCLGEIQRYELDMECCEKDLEGLTKFKQAATRGEETDYSGLSFLGRALCETIRVYPPIWTLPRTWPRQSHLVDLKQKDAIRWSKVDVPSINGAKNPHEDWNPEHVKPTHIASFGLGRRHCPAGTAALHAVYHAMTSVLKLVDSMEQSSDGINPVASAMLLPTLQIASG